MGTEQLLRIAVALREYNFRTTHLQLVNSNMLPLSDPAQEQDVREEAIMLLLVSTAEDVLSYFRQRARGIHVVAIEMRVAKGGGRITLRRDGWITVHNTRNTPLVKSSLQETSELVGIV
ncbi:hypothetical protein CH273_02180 [Rhodococcus sp. 05-339-2]|nr:hypothetical protein CH273_02180 [Rhodococcus sp. 05-339-2]